jgi:hypothetical protein
MTINLCANNGIRKMRAELEQEGKLSVQNHTAAN